MPINLHKQILENLYEGVYFVDTELRITFWNKGAERISGFSAEEVVGKPCSDNILKHLDGAGCELCIDGCPLHATIEDGNMREAPVYLHHKNGHRVPVSIRAVPIYEEGKVIGAAEVFTDRREQFEHLKDLRELQELASKDELTELPNRRCLQEELGTIWQQYEQSRIPFGMIFMDIDWFKRVNDTHGHTVGDEILKMVAQSTRTTLRRSDLVGRWGGEEFLVILPEASEQTLPIVAEKIRKVIENSTCRTEAGELSVTVSLGATPYKEDRLDDMIKRVDEMMYASKSNGRNCVTVAAEGAFSM